MQVLLRMSFHTHVGVGHQSLVISFFPMTNDCSLMTDANGSTQ